MSNIFSDFKLIFTGDIHELWLVKISRDDITTLRRFCNEYAELRGIECIPLDHDITYANDHVTICGVNSDGSTGSVIERLLLDKNTNTWNWE